MHDRSHLPVYNFARYKFSDTGYLRLRASQRPPFVFRGVSSRVFPIRANISRLRGFIDNYLNLNSLGGRNCFRPAGPMLFLMILDYGRMAVEANNLGWVSQKEVTFTIPLEWYVKKGKRLVFKDWAMVSPFIFVDSDWSLMTGREVYGWPKVFSTVPPCVPRWADDVRSPELQFRLETNVFPEVYAGQRQVLRRLIDIEYGPAPALASAPVNFLKNQSFLGNPMQAVQSTLDIGSMLAQYLGGLPLFGFENRTVPGVVQQAVKAGSYMNPRAKVETHNITLKQFSDCEIPHRACYQGLVDSMMSIERLNAAGMLGDPFQRRMDPSGGYTIKIYEYDAQPVIDSLGIEVEKREDVNGRTAALLKPMYPYWLDLDMGYGAGCLLEEDAKVVSSDPGGTSSALHVGQPTATHGVSAFNTARGAAGQEVLGPFHFPNTTVRVLPLLADHEKLSGFIDGYLNVNADRRKHRFRAWGSYVYLVATNYEGMASETNNLGLWANREIEFLVPVLWDTWKHGAWELRTAACVPAYAFVDSSTAAITGREVNGRPAERADISAFDDVWVDTRGPGKYRRHMRVSSTLFPTLYQGQKATSRPLIDINGGPCPHVDDRVGRRWERALACAPHDEAQFADEDGYGQAVFDLENLAARIPFGDLPVQTDAGADADANAPGGHPCDEDEIPPAAINYVTLKQFRDAQDANRACFQSIVSYTRRVERLYELEQIPQEGHGGLHVSIARYDGMPIAKVLGLVPTATTSQGKAITDWFSPQGPFWMRLALRETLGVDESLYAAGKWQVDTRRVPADFVTGWNV